jgi:hypothetical protein
LNVVSSDLTFRWRSRAIAAKHKARMLRYGVVSACAGALLARRKLRDRVLLWPAFDPVRDAAVLDRTLRHAAHYLAGSGLSIELLLAVDGRLRLCAGAPDGSRPPVGEEVSSGAAEARRRSARFVALWNEQALPRATSLHRERYVIADLKDHCEARDWLRLLADVRQDRRRTTECRLPPAPVTSCAVLGSGPSISLFAGERARYDACIAMNSAVFDDCVRTAPNLFAVCALDPDYFSPQESVRPFWETVFPILRSSPAVFVTSLAYAPFVELHFPADIRAKCHYVRTLGQDTLAWRSRFDLRDLRVTPYGNVLTDLALPLASAVSREVTIYGCDGRAPGRAGANFEKHAALESFDTQFEQERPGKYGTAMLDGQIRRFYHVTRVVADECLRHGVRLQVRARSHNLGLGHLPVAAPEPR